MKQTAAIRGVDLTSMFGEDTAPTAVRVLKAIGAEPSRVFTAFELLDEANIESCVDGFLVLARLTSRGLIAHPGPGVYSSLEHEARAGGGDRAA
ncbi:hypothetical protein [Gemmatimonas sp.]|uniref:hypothetical protein n=1 Tax=Gemmatimonas sp. TaxID=1962908 RepID=UPI003568EA5D